ncbi:MAG: hypothetical protein QOE90_65, partial [Thermoplasmata archaeon]|nr:hypothetical protein [Thermoplasmata archaeon]
MGKMRAVEGGQVLRGGGRGRG